MGLDVYLYKCPDRAVADAAEKKANDYSELVWSKHEKYEDFSEEEKEENRTLIDAYNAACGIVGYSYKTRTKIELPSAKYPNHYFKIGYFRSSYNGIGINKVMRNIGLPDLYDLFGSENGDEDSPDWDAARIRVTDAITKFAEYLAGPFGKIGVMQLGNSLFSGKTKDEAEAMRSFVQVYEANQGCESDGGFSTRDGTFFLSGLKFFGFVDGTTYGNRPCVYGIFEAEGREWYLHALEIVLETIDYVLAQPDREQYYLSWSG